ncbi:unannotated protein [freshwater metagenome]|uniref:Unannotated protein n=1 Tax=freshwater metagenome TaxID=449393 RepID=A0A6J6JFJ1_9ZZZZ
MRTRISPAFGASRSTSAISIGELPRVIAALIVCLLIIYLFP